MDFAGMFQTWLNVLTRPGESVFEEERQSENLELRDRGGRRGRGPGWVRAGRRGGATRGALRGLDVVLWLCLG